MSTVTFHEKRILKESLLDLKYKLDKLNIKHKEKVRFLVDELLSELDNIPGEEKYEFLKLDQQQLIKMIKRMSIPVKVILPSGKEYVWHPADSDFVEITYPNNNSYKIVDVYELSIHMLKKILLAQILDNRNGGTYSIYKVKG